MTKEEKVAQLMRSQLEAAFDPDTLEIIDESESHRGHAGFQEGGESHFRIIISAAAFASMTRIARHRAIHSALGPDVIGRIHALALDVS